MRQCAQLPWLKGVKAQDFVCMVQQRQQQLRLGVHVEFDEAPQQYHQGSWLQDRDDVGQVCEQRLQQLLPVLVMLMLWVVVQSLLLLLLLLLV
jgi:hypothetical protein